MDTLASKFLPSHMKLASIFYTDELDFSHWLHSVSFVGKRIRRKLSIICPCVCRNRACGFAFHRFPNPDCDRRIQKRKQNPCVAFGRGLFADVHRCCRKRCGSKTILRNCRKIQHIQRGDFYGSHFNMRIC